MNIDWSKAPEWAEFYARGLFRMVGEAWSESESCWKNSAWPESFFMDAHDYEPRPQELPTENRTDIIGQNGNDGLHYTQVPQTAAEFLSAGLEILSERGKQYSSAGDERSFP